MAAVVSLVAFASCSDDERDIPPVTDGDTAECTLGFLINVGDNSGFDVASRATPSGDYDRGSGYENYIDLPGRDFMFLFFDTENRYLGRFNVSGIIPLDGMTGSSKRYQVLGSAGTLDLRNRSFKVVALANWRHSYPALTPGVSTIDDLTREVYDFSNPFMPSADNTIPLFGVKTFADGVTFDSNNYASIGTLHLLRAMAKIEVVCATANWTLGSVKVTRYNKSGLMAPTGVDDESKYVHDSWPADYVDHVSIPDGVTQSTGLEFVESPLPSGGTVFTVYLPEFRNIGADGKQVADPARIEITFNESAKSYNLEFDTYIDGAPSGKPFDINRNYFYRYTITKSDEWGDIGVTLDIEPYSKVELNPDHGLERDENGNIIYHRGSDGTLYLLDIEAKRCFIIDSNGDRAYVDNIYDSSLGQYIHWYEAGYGYFFDRVARRWYFRPENGEIFYVTYRLNDTTYYYDPVRRQCYEVTGGTRRYVTRVTDAETGRNLYNFVKGISYFYDTIHGEHYYRTTYGEVVYVSMTVEGIHYIYDMESDRYYIEGTSDFVDCIVDPETGRTLYSRDDGRSFFLDRATDEYFYRNPDGDKVFVTMTVDGIDYMFSIAEQRYFHIDAGGDRIFVDVITDIKVNRILYSHVNGIAYFWDSKRMCYYYRDADGRAVDVWNLPNN